MSEFFIGNKRFFNIDKATKYAKTKSLTIGDDGHVRLKIRTWRKPPNVIFPYEYQIQVFHNGERVYFDDPERPNGYIKDTTE